ncbi:aminomethyl-transferring glycine dehydrogenase [soil metagenome]
MTINLNPAEKFENRHIGPDEVQIKEMLQFIGADSLDHLIEQTVPKSIQLNKVPELPQAKTEHEFLTNFKKLSKKNNVFKSLIGLGYHDCIIPPVIQRNILENPGWYTAYTPYQAEVSQGRLEALINFQTMVMDLTGMEIANASLLDEGTAAAEAMTMGFDSRKGPGKNSPTFLVDENTLPQTIDVLKTRALPLGIKLNIKTIENKDLKDDQYFGIFLQYPGADGLVVDYGSIISSAKDKGLFVAVAADLLSLAILTPPGEMGADVVVGTTQRLGVPLGYGGPHAAYFATKEEFKRQIPGRIIGVSVDKDGNKAYRMALQTREQHIRREKATSNICTAQVLLAVISGMFAVYHGPEGIKKIALKTYGLTKLLAEGLNHLKIEQLNIAFFDTIKVKVDEEKLNLIKIAALEGHFNFRYYNKNYIGISFNETTSVEDVKNILNIFAEVFSKDLKNFNLSAKAEAVELTLPQNLLRKSDYLTHPVFNTHHSEHEMLRYLKKLENKDLSLAHSMIPLGSCTMKLNATAEMIPLSWPEFNSIHPFAPADQTTGYDQLFNDLESWLSAITGFAATSLQPNSGAQGEYAGLMVIRAYHQSRGEDHRNVTLIPTSAHGTNPASAVMAGMKVVLVKCDEQGNIDIEDLKKKASEHKDDLSALMITYPSTHGVFEEGIKNVCEIIHESGGQVYMDGANMNAQVGITSPANIGADVCHLNLHKTFCIPHGGGGPGMGPICVAAHLKPFLPGNPLIKTGGSEAISSISAAPWGSASILTISYAYISMMGLEGLKRATQVAILNANYIKEKLKEHFPVLFTGRNNRCAHELIIDCREFKKAGIEVEDIAKRLLDYNFHSPTVSFPVPGTLMIEPTESEPKEEIDRFCEAMIEIRKEISEIESGKADKQNNVLKNAPHTASLALSEHWELPYSRKKAVFPLPYVEQNKFWPTVRRVDSAYGDRNLMCSCIPLEEYMQKKEEELIA